MDLEQLRIYLAVAERQSFTAAARALFVSHSTTSRAVSALERELETQLLVRHGRSVTLTPAGEFLQAEAAKLLSQAEALRVAVRKEKETEQEKPDHEQS